MSSNRTPSTTPLRYTFAGLLLLAPLVLNACNLPLRLYGSDDKPKPAPAKAEVDKQKGSDGKTAEPGKEICVVKLSGSAAELAAPLVEEIRVAGESTVQAIEETWKKEHGTRRGILRNMIREYAKQSFGLKNEELSQFVEGMLKLGAPAPAPAPKPVGMDEDEAGKPVESKPAVPGSVVAFVIHKLASTFAEQELEIREDAGKKFADDTIASPSVVSFAAYREFFRFAHASGPDRPSLAPIEAKRLADELIKLPQGPEAVATYIDVYTAAISYEFSREEAQKRAEAALCLLKK